MLTEHKLSAIVYIYQYIREMNMSISPLKKLGKFKIWLYKNRKQNILFIFIRYLSVYEAL